jgi:hypothetical protein
VHDELPAALAGPVIEVAQPTASGTGENADAAVDGIDQVVPRGLGGDVRR